ncbi:MAG: EAL domain-containing protein, partial [Actinomycetota bacterium]
GPRVGFGITQGGAFEHALGKVAQQIRRWPAGTVVSFNVTLDQLLDEQLVGRVTGVAERAAIDPHSFLFEIDAALVETDPSGARRAIERLHEDAWSVTLDRIESAVSPLHLLAVVPVDLVKIDQAGLQEASRDRLEVLTAVAATARRLGIGTVASGVATLPELASAIAHGFDLAQGPLFGEQVSTAARRGEATGPAVAQ